MTNMTNKEIYKMVKSSMLNNPKEWCADTHNVYCKSLGLKFWTANGLPSFELSTMSYVDYSYIFEMDVNNPEYKRRVRLREEKIKLSIFQTINLHIIFLRNIKNYPHILILLRYLIVTLFSVGVVSLASPLIIWATNYTNNKNVDLILSISEIREQRLKKILDKKLQINDK